MARSRSWGSGRRRGVTVDIDAAAFQRSVRKAAAEFEVETHEEVGALANEIRNRATRYTAVDTGRAKAGWQATEGRDGEGLFWAVGNGVDYVPDLEFGTSKMRPQPMLRPAIAEAVGVQGVGVEIPTAYEQEA